MTRTSKKSESNPQSATSAQSHEDGASPISKAQAVRNALAEGLDDIGDIEGFLKSRYGIDMPRQMISSYKSQNKAKEAEARPVVKVARSEAGGSSTHGVRESDPESDLLEALEAMKPLVEKFGADKVKRIVDLLG